MGPSVSSCSASPGQSVSELWWGSFSPCFQGSAVRWPTPHWLPFTSFKIFCPDIAQVLFCNYRVWRETLPKSFPRYQVKWWLPWHKPNTWWSKRLLPWQEPHVAGPSSKWGIRRELSTCSLCQRCQEGSHLRFGIFSNERDRTESQETGSSGAKAKFSLISIAAFETILQPK